MGFNRENMVFEEKQNRCFVYRRFLLGSSSTKQSPGSDGRNFEWFFPLCVKSDRLANSYSCSTVQITVAGLIASD